MSKFSIADMVRNSIDDKPVDMKNSFADAMLDKIRDHLEAKKQDLVDAFYNTDDGDETEDDTDNTTDDDTYVDVDDEDDTDFDEDDEVEDSDTEVEDDDENTQ